MPAATATPVFPISEQNDGFDFDPQMYYAQVLFITFFGTFLLLFYIIPFFPMMLAFFHNIAGAGNHGRFETLNRPLSINGSKAIVAGGDISSSKVADVQKSV